MEPLKPLVDCPGDSLSGDAAIGVGIGPANGASAVCVRANVLHQFAAEIGDRRKHAASNDVALDFGEPKLHLIQPRRIRRGEVKTYLRMFRQELLDGLSLMRGKVIKHDMNLASPLGLAD